MELLVEETAEDRPDPDGGVAGNPPPPPPPNSCRPVLNLLQDRLCSGGEGHSLHLWIRGDASTAWVRLEALLF